jgi:glycosyltransferase involved in cell wall biosynthesis
MKDLRIVIPAYNEEASVGAVIDRVRKACPEAEVIVVDDGSKDRTAAIARGKGVKVISYATNLSYGAALKVGFSYNNQDGFQMKYLAFLDADGTYPAEKVPELCGLCKARDYDIAVDSRFLGKNEGMPLMRRVGNRIFALLTSIYTGKKVTDTGSGLRIFRASLVPWMQQPPDGLNFTPAMTIKALFDGLTYIEIPIEYNRRVGESKLSSSKDGYRFLRVIMNAARQHRPWLFYFTLGIPFLVVNLLVKNRL